MDYDRNDALLHWLFRQTQGDAWFRPNEQHISSGVALRISDVHDPVPEFRVFPYENPSLEPFETAVAALNPAVAVKIRSAAVHAALAAVPPDDHTVYVDANTRIQILDTMLALPAADKEQCAAFIRDERVLVVWSDVLDRIVPICTDFEDRLIKLLWRASPATPSSNTHTPSLCQTQSARSSIDALASPPKRTSLASMPTSSPLRPAPPSAKKFKRTWYGRKVPVHQPEELPMDEKGVVEQEDEDSKWNEAKQTRRTMLWAPLYNGLAAALSLIFIGNGIKLLFQEWTLDAGVTRFALLAVCPLLYCVALFFALQIIQNISMVIGPIEQYHSNSTYYSGVKPQANPKIDHALPHITIQMPVYKEGLDAVLAPSILSIKRAMQTYARQGGTSSIFVCDDGLRLMPVHEQQERARFYAGHGIGWVARPGHGATPDDSIDDDGQVDLEKGLGKGKRKQGEMGHKAFVRAGRFKKASNLNYGLALSLKAERHLAKLLKHQKEVKEAQQEHQQSEDVTTENSIASSRRTPTPPLAPPSLVADTSLLGIPSFTHANGTSTPLRGSSSTSNLHHPSTPTAPSFNHTPAQASLEDQALALAIAECASESGFRPWAANGRNVRMGEIVLLVDSDTVVPEDCLRDAAREMAVCPDVAIIQHESDVMQVVHHYFENGIAYFTRRINRTISMACANGEVAPFVGHNAFLRWRALQDVAFVDSADGVEKIWSESNVSEDFDMALRLLSKGYIVRWATYSKGEFKEGVSLSVDDELNRWQKYAYGCSELLFNPFVQWFRRGPIAHQIHKFMWSSAPMHYKIAMMAYMFSYYGIAVSITISIINYVLLGFQFGVDRFYMHSFEIWLATTVVFFGSGTVGYSILQYRLGLKQLAILAHMFSYNISWSATIKEVQRSNFFKEIPKIAK
ncbi:hypothetical protein C0989_011806, partial [Termitomyces sp. Mn162]